MPYVDTVEPRRPAVGHLERQARLLLRLHPIAMPDARSQLFWLFVLAAPIASIAWTVTHEEVLREPREWCAARSKSCKRLLERKIFYLFTCEFCFSHYVTALFLWITGFRLLLDDWRGYLIAEFALVWVANIYMSLFGRLRLDIKEERLEISVAEAKQRRGPEPIDAAMTGRTADVTNRQRR